MMPEHEPNATVPVLTTGQLHTLVRQTIESYLAELEGEPPGHLYQLVMKQVEPALLEVVLNYTEGRVSRAAKVLGIDRGTLSKKLDRYDIDAKECRHHQR